MNITPSDIVAFISVYFCAWWLCIFLVLPWGNNEKADSTLGQAASAPKNARIRLKFAITSLIALVVAIIIMYGRSKGWFDLENM